MTETVLRHPQQTETATEGNGQRSGSIQSVERAVAVLKLFGEAEPELGVSDLARRLRLHKSTVSRLLSTLEAGGFVKQDPRSGRYRLGLQLATLAGLALTQYELRDVARPLLQELANETGETTTVSVIEGMEAVNIDQALAPHPVKHLGWIGRRLPLHCTAAGKPLLAHLPSSTVERYLTRPLASYTARTVTSPELLRRELERIRAQGFAVGQEEYEADLSAVGSAVRDYRGDVVASITVSGPSFRLSPDRLAQLGNTVRQAAGRISAQLGHRSGGEGSVRSAPGGAGRAVATLAPRPAPQTPAAPGANTGANTGANAGANTSDGDKTDGRRPAVGVAGPMLGR